MLKLYDYKILGNCYKARLMSLLKLEHEIIPENIVVWLDLVKNLSGYIDLPQ